LSGDVKPAWTPTAVTNIDEATTNHDDDSSGPTGSSTSTMPITWETNWNDVVSELRKNEPLYTFLLANFAGRVTGMSKWNFDAMSGAKAPAEVLSVSSEALLLLFLLNYSKAWKSQANNDPQLQPEESSIESGSVSSISMASITLYTKQKNSSTKDGWSVEGIRHFEELMVKVKEDRNSDHGKQFEEKFQQLMKDRLAADQVSRKRGRVSITEQLTTITNELSDASSSSEDEN
jgi:hypothetical protein